MKKGTRKKTAAGASNGSSGDAHTKERACACGCGERFTPSERFRGNAHSVGQIYARRACATRAAQRKLRARARIGTLRGAKAS